MDDVIKFVSDKSSSIRLNLVKHKIDDVVTINKKRDKTMTFKDLKKRINSSFNQQQTQSFEHL